MAILSDLHSANRGALSVRIIIQDSVPVPCQGLSLPILAYATNLDYASLKYGRSLHKMLSHLQTSGSSHANVSTPLKCTITVSHTDCICMHRHISCTRSYGKPSVSKTTSLDVDVKPWDVDVKPWDVDVKMKTYVE